MVTVEWFHLHLGVMVSQILLVAVLIACALAPCSLATSAPTNNQSQKEEPHTTFSCPEPAGSSGGINTDVTPTWETLDTSSSEAEEYLSQPVPALNTTLTLGYLVEYQVQGPTTSRDMKQVSGALAYAVHQINQQNVLPGYTLAFVTRDTHMRTNDSLMAMTMLWRDQVVGFIASPTSCHNEAMLAGAWNLPILSYLCHSDKVLDRRDYPTIIQTFPPADSILSSVISLLKQFHWNKFSIIYGRTLNGKQYEMLALRLRNMAMEHGLSVNHFLDFEEPVLPRDNASAFHSTIERTFEETRIYLLIGSVNAVVNFTDTLNRRGLVSGGLYQIIYVENVESIADKPDKYFRMTYHSAPVYGSETYYNEQKMYVQASRCLLVVRSTPHEESVDFIKSVREFNNLPPFNFSSHFKKRIPQHASHLYDAIIIYAKALSQVIQAGGSYRDGRAITSHILGRTYTSIQGYLANIDKEGNAEGNYTVLALGSQVCNNTLIPAMLPIANFLLNDDGQLPKFHMIDGKSITWINGEPPAAEPECGYRGQKCIQKDSHIWEITGGVLSGLVFSAAVVCLFMYRNWRYEREIEGLLWKIDRSAIQFSEMTAECCNKTLCYGHSNNPVCYHTSMVSMGSRSSLAQVYSFVGQYKGQIVALKTYNLGTTVLTRREKTEMKTMRELLHKNVNTFIGACLESSVLTLVTVYCHKGSLQDVLDNDDMKLENVFISSLIKDLIQAMMYIHNSELIFHGNLKSSNCVVTSRWTLQVADFGLLDIRTGRRNQEDHYAYYRNLLWKSPEVLRSRGKIQGSQSADVYAFAMILYEVFGRTGPYGGVITDPEEIIRKVAEYSSDDLEPFRPSLTHLPCDDYIKEVMTSCWAENPSDRPNFPLIWRRLKPMRAGMDRNIFDHMLAMMEKYQEHLEDLVDQRTEQYHEEKRKTEMLLYRMLPRSVAEQLKRGEPVVPEAFDSVTVYFSDICGFTSLSAHSTPMQIVDMLNDLYTCFDSIIKHFDVYKVETIGDAYMVVSGLPIRNGCSHATEIASMSLTLLEAITSFKIRHRPDEVLKLRIGIHSGPCVAGVVGLTMPRYTLFGDTINTASRIESHGQALRIHCSCHTKKLLEVIGGFRLEERGYINLKGKGSQLTYWILGTDDGKGSQLQLQQHPHVRDSAQQHPHVCGSAQQQPHMSDSAQQQPHMSDSAQQQPHIRGSAQQQPHISDTVQQHHDISDSAQQQPPISDTVQQHHDISDSAQQEPHISDTVQQHHDISDSAQQQPHIFESFPQHIQDIFIDRSKLRHQRHDPLLHTQSHNRLMPGRCHLDASQPPDFVDKSCSAPNVACSTHKPCLNSVLTQPSVTSLKRSLNSVLTEPSVTSLKGSLNSVLTQPSVTSLKRSLNDLTLLRKKELSQKSHLQQVIDLYGNGRDRSAELALLMDHLPMTTVQDTNL